MSSNIGRPEVNIDWDTVDNLLIKGCSGMEVSAAIGIHQTTLYRKCAEERGMPFSDYYTQKRAKGDAYLYTAQYDKAMSGDNTMLVWLGKNRLKQRENPTELTVSTETVKNFDSMMNQLSSLQEAAKLAHDNKSAEKIVVGDAASHSDGG